MTEGSNQNVWIDMHPARPANGERGTAARGGAWKQERTGVSTLAHSSSQEVGRPLVQAVAALVQHAEFTSASHAWKEASSVHMSGAPPA